MSLDQVVCVVIGNRAKQHCTCTHLHFWWCYPSLQIRTDSEYGCQGKFPVFFVANVINRPALQQGLLQQPLSALGIFKGLFAQGPWRFFSFVNLFAAMRPFCFDRSSPEATQPRGARTVTCGKLEVLGSSTVYAMSLRRMWAWGVFSAVQPLRRIPRHRARSLPPAHRPKNAVARYSKCV